MMKALLERMKSKPELKLNPSVVASAHWGTWQRKLGEWEKELRSRRAGPSISLGRMGAKLGQSSPTPKGDLKQIVVVYCYSVIGFSMTKAATSAAAEKTTAAASAATQLEVGAVGDKLTQGRSSLEGSASASLGVVKGVGGGALGVGKGVGARARCVCDFLT